jgi:hypothetical protein
MLPRLSIKGGGSGRTFKLRGDRDVAYNNRLYYDSCAGSQDGWEITLQTLPTDGIPNSYTDGSNIGKLALQNLKSSKLKLIQVEITK